MVLQKGEVLMSQNQGEAISGLQSPGGKINAFDRVGLFFIESGFITVERDPQQSTRGRLQEQKEAHESRQLARVMARTFRLMRLGPGWVIGAEEITSGYRSIGIFCADSPCVLHFLSFAAIKRAEKQDPMLVLTLFKLLGRLISERYDRSKEQLSNMMDTVYTRPGRASLVHDVRRRKKGKANAKAKGKTKGIRRNRASPCAVSKDMGGRRV
jgi:CRP-like cAMP-binding protein